MAGFKPLLKIGEITVLERVVDLFRDAGIEDIRVVVGHRATDLVPALQKRAVRWVLNEKYREGMLSSIKKGVSTLEPDREAFFLLPVDIPLVRKSTLADLIQRYQESGKSIAYPTLHGKRGHPPLIAAKYAHEILQWDGHDGLRGFLKQKDGEAVNVPVADEYIGLDMDTPEDYRNILGKLKDYGIPSESECMVLLAEKLSLNTQLLAHSRAVAQLALRLGSELNEKGAGLNLKLVTAAALLHHIGRGKADQPSVAAQILHKLDYPAVAEVVVVHTGRPDSDRENLNERDVVCLSDKLVQGDCIVPLETRFRKELDRYRNDPVALKAIERKLDRARTLKSRVEAALAEPIEHFISRLPPQDLGASEGDQFTEAR